MNDFKFSRQVRDQLKHYVYRLIDPRNGETFYVGMGKGNRVFKHVKDELGAEADELTDKLERIRQIRTARFEVSHVIHRHGMDKETAEHVEAALIEAYPGILNEINGHGSAGVAGLGVMHADQIIVRYGAPSSGIQAKRQSHADLCQSVH